MVNGEIAEGVTGKTPVLLPYKLVSNGLPRLQSWVYTYSQDVIE